MNYFHILKENTKVSKCISSRIYLFQIHALYIWKYRFVFCRETKLYMLLYIELRTRSSRAFRWNTLRLKFKVTIFLKIRYNWEICWYPLGYYVDTWINTMHNKIKKNFAILQIVKHHGLRLSTSLCDLHAFTCYN